MSAVFHRNPTTRRRRAAPVVWRSEPAARPAGVSTHWHRNPGRLCGARQYQPVYTRAGSKDSIKAPMQGRPPWEAPCPLQGDQRWCSGGAVGRMGGQCSDGAASAGQG